MSVRWLLHIDVADDSWATGVNGWLRKRHRFRQPLFVPFAERTVPAQIAVFCTESRVVESQPLLQIEQLTCLVFREVLDPSQLSCEKKDPAIGIQDLGLPEGIHQVFAKAHGTVALQNDRVRSFKKRGVRSLQTSRRPGSRTEQEALRP